VCVCVCVCVFGGGGRQHVVAMRNILRYLRERSVIATLLCAVFVSLQNLSLSLSLTHTHAHTHARAHISILVAGTVFLLELKIVYVTLWGSVNLTDRRPRHRWNTDTAVKDTCRAVWTGLVTYFLVRRTTVTHIRIPG
jgi:hypothetical protein